MYFVVTRVSFQCHRPSFNKQFHVLFSFLLFSLVIPLLLFFFCSFSRCVLYLFSTPLVYFPRYNLSNHRQTQQVPWSLKTKWLYYIQNLGTFETPFTRAKKISTARQIFGTVPLGGSLGTPKHWCHITFGTDTFTRRKLGMPCPKIVSMVPKIWRAVPIFLARVNGVWVAGLCATIVEDRCSSGNPEAEAYFYCFFLFPSSGTVAMF